MFSGLKNWFKLRVYCQTTIKGKWIQYAGNTTLVALKTKQNKKTFWQCWLCHFTSHSYHTQPFHRCTTYLRPQPSEGWNNPATAILLEDRVELLLAQPYRKCLLSQVFFIIFSVPYVSQKFLHLYLWGKGEGEQEGRKKHQNKEIPLFMFKKRTQFNTLTVFS